MAQALRKIWLEPEEAHESVAPQIASHNRRQQAAIPWSQTAMILALATIIIGCFVTYINSYARIAKLEMERQLLLRESEQLAREHTQLSLQLDRFSAQPRVTALAQAEGLELPNADRISYIRITDTLPDAVVASVSPTARQESWLLRTSKLVTAGLDDAIDRLSHGPHSLAYAQE